MGKSSRFSRAAELVRYYQVGIINTAFGFGIYLLLVKMGLNPYFAQILSHCLGVIFNYLTYSRHVFRHAHARVSRFLASYVGNYLLSLGTLAVALHFVTSPYAAGAISIIVTSLINYFALKHLVFVHRGSP